MPRCPLLCLWHPCCVSWTLTPYRSSRGLVRRESGGGGAVTWQNVGLATFPKFRDHMITEMSQVRHSSTAPATTSPRLAEPQPPCTQHARCHRTQQGCTIMSAGDGHKRVGEWAFMSFPSKFVSFL